MLIGLKSRQVVGAEFLFKGRIMADFQEEGKWQFLKDALKMKVIVGRIAKSMSLMRRMGIPSEPTALLRILRIANNTSDCMTGLK